MAMLVVPKAKASSETSVNHVMRDLAEEKRSNASGGNHALDVRGEVVDARWSSAELRAGELIDRLMPTPVSDEKRNAIANYVQLLIQRRFDCRVFVYGSVRLKTYLPDGDIDLTIYSTDPMLKDIWADQVQSVLEDEQQNEAADYDIKDIKYIQAEVKLVKCTVDDFLVDISLNSLAGLCKLCFLEQVDRLVGQGNLLKRSIILAKAWGNYESRVLGAHHGLLTTYALETLLLYIFQTQHSVLRGPLQVLLAFLEFYSVFDWERYCVSLWGPVPLHNLPCMTAEPLIVPEGGSLLLDNEALGRCWRLYAVEDCGETSASGHFFKRRHLNVVDPLLTTNNLGRSVSKVQMTRIRNMLKRDAQRLREVVQTSGEHEMLLALDSFFRNSWEVARELPHPRAPLSSQPQSLGSLTMQAPEDLAVVEEDTKPCSQAVGSLQQGEEAGSFEDRDGAASAKACNGVEKLPGGIVQERLSGAEDANVSSASSEGAGKSRPELRRRDEDGSQGVVGSRDPDVEGGVEELGSHRGQGSGGGLCHLMGVGGLIEQTDDLGNLRGEVEQAGNRDAAGTCCPLLPEAAVQLSQLDWPELSPRMSPGHPAQSSISPSAWAGRSHRRSLSASASIGQQDWGSTPARMPDQGRVEVCSGTCSTDQTGRREDVGREHEEQTPPCKGSSIANGQSPGAHVGGPQPHPSGQDPGRTSTSMAACGEPSGNTGDASRMGCGTSGREASVFGPPPALAESPSPSSSGCGSPAHIARPRSVPLPAAARVPGALHAQARAGPPQLLVGSPVATPAVTPSPASPSVSGGPFLANSRVQAHVPGAGYQQLGGLQQAGPAHPHLFPSVLPVGCPPLVRPVLVSNGAYPGLQFCPAGVICPPAGEVGPPLGMAALGAGFLPGGPLRLPAATGLVPGTSSLGAQRLQDTAGIGANESGLGFIPALEAVRAHQQHIMGKPGSTEGLAPPGGGVMSSGTTQGPTGNFSGRGSESGQELHRPSTPPTPPLMHHRSRHTSGGGPRSDSSESLGSPISRGNNGGWRSDDDDVQLEPIARDNAGLVNEPCEVSDSKDLMHGRVPGMAKLNTGMSGSRATGGAAVLNGSTGRQDVESGPAVSHPYGSGSVMAVDQLPGFSRHDVRSGGQKVKGGRLPAKNRTVETTYASRDVGVSSQPTLQRAGNGSFASGQYSPMAGHAMSVGQPGRPAEFLPLPPLASVGPQALSAEQRPAPSVPPIATLEALPSSMAAPLQLVAKPVSPGSADSAIMAAVTSAGGGSASPQLRSSGSLSSTPPAAAGSRSPVAASMGRVHLPAAERFGGASPTNGTSMAPWMLPGPQLLVPVNGAGAGPVVAAENGLGTAGQMPLLVSQNGFFWAAPRQMPPWGQGMREMHVSTADAWEQEHRARSPQPPVQLLFRAQDGRFVGQVVPVGAGGGWGGQANTFLGGSPGSCFSQRTAEGPLSGNFQDFFEDLGFARECRDAERNLERQEQRLGNGGWVGGAVPGQWQARPGFSPRRPLWPMPRGPPQQWSGSTRQREQRPPGPALLERQPDMGFGAMGPRSPGRQPGAWNQGAAGGERTAMGGESSGDAEARRRGAPRGQPGRLSRSMSMPSVVAGHGALGGREGEVMGPPFPHQLNGGFRRVVQGVNGAGMPGAQGAGERPPASRGTGAYIALPGSLGATLASSPRPSSGQVQSRIHPGRAYGRPYNHEGDVAAADSAQRQAALRGYSGIPSGPRSAWAQPLLREEGGEGWPGPAEWGRQGQRPPSPGRHSSSVDPRGRSLSPFRGPLRRADSRSGSPRGHQFHAWQAQHAAGAQQPHAWSPSPPSASNGGGFGGSYISHKRWHHKGRSLGRRLGPSAPVSPGVRAPDVQQEPGWASSGMGDVSPGGTASPSAAAAAAGGGPSGRPSQTGMLGSPTSRAEAREHGRPVVSVTSSGASSPDSSSPKYQSRTHRLPTGGVSSPPVAFHPHSGRFGEASQGENMSLGVKMGGTLPRPPPVVTLQGGHHQSGILPAPLNGEFGGGATADVVLTRSTGAGEQHQWRLGGPQGATEVAHVSDVEQREGLDIHTATPEAAADVVAPTDGELSLLKGHMGDAAEGVGGRPDVVADGPQFGTEGSRKAAAEDSNVEQHSSDAPPYHFMEDDFPPLLKKN